MRLLTLALVTVVASSSVWARTFTFDGGANGQPESPYRFLVDPDEGDGPIELASEDGIILPVQRDEGEGAVWAWFIIPALAPRQNLQLRTRPATREWPDEVSLTTKGGDVDVLVHGDLFTRYVTTDGPKPYCYPVIGPTGVGVTRSYPMQRVEGESEDHPHQMSLFFGHGEVNGCDFWATGHDRGRMVHREFLSIVSGPVFGSLTALTDWVDPDGVTVCSDVRTLRFYATRDTRVMDYEVTVQADHGPLHFGDTKEGMMSFRVAETLRADQGGTLINSEGQTGDETWGKKARWCDNYGPLAGDTIGIAILDAPVNLRHPTTWHVRSYGLFGANPFGLMHYWGEGAPDGTLDLAEGESVTFRYRFVIHRGTPEEAGIEDMWQYYARGFDEPIMR